ncbi:stress-responsive transcription factor hsf1 [Actinomortierella wolfii]|nr:stress-responsive transcription factor hsf1 [Actinomortierella wolfii]
MSPSTTSPTLLPANADNSNSNTTSIVHSSHSTPNLSDPTTASPAAVFGNISLPPTTPTSAVASSTALTSVANPSSALTIVNSNLANISRSLPPGLLTNPANIDAAMALLQSTSGSTAGKITTTSARSSVASSTARNGVDTPPLQPHPRPSNNTRGNVAAFLTKLYNMVSEPSSDNLIRWSPDGQSFIVANHVEFAKEVLPKFFKHNNFSSFVRQLNMYGFHKVPHLQQGVLMPDSDSEQWEFSNPHFQRNQPDLLCLVSRKKASSANEDKDALTMDLGHILAEVAAIKKHQVAISADLRNIERDHQSLWQESIAARERHQRQQETIDKILRFLASVFSGDKKRAIVPNKKPRLTITEGHVDDTADVSDTTDSVPLNISSETEEEVAPIAGNKRKRVSVVDVEEHAPTIPTINTAAITPAQLSTVADRARLSNANASTVTPKTISQTASTLTTAATTPNAILQASKTPTPTISMAPSPSTASSDYLNPAYPGINYSAQPFKLDPSVLNIPTALFPPNVMTAAQHDMLRAMSQDNSKNSLPAPPMIPAFADTPAGANVIKGVDQITAEMEQLQKHLEALREYGLDIDDVPLANDDQYMNLGTNFDPNAFPGLDGIGDSAIPHQDVDGTEDIADLINTEGFLSGTTGSAPSPSLTSSVASTPATVVSTPTSAATVIPVSSTLSNSVATPDPTLVLGEDGLPLSSLTTQPLSTSLSGSAGHLGSDLLDLEPIPLPTITTMQLVSSALGYLALFVTVATVSAISPQDLDEDFQKVTCGSSIKLAHEGTGMRLHSHPVTYGSGSGQQSVTAFQGSDDTNSLWTVMGAHGYTCERGEPVPCGSTIRLKHVNSRKFLHSHGAHRSPMSGGFEVSAYDGMDRGDNWVVQCPSGTQSKNSGFWLRESPIQLAHEDTDSALLTASKRYVYGSPIPGQLEVAGHKASYMISASDQRWIAQEGIYFADRNNAKDEF